MNKRIFLIFVLLCPIVLIAQDYSALWKGHFSYLNVKDVSQGNGKIYVAAENAVFSYDINSYEIESLSTINGLSGDEISAIYYSEAYEMLIIGYSNGLIEIALDNDDNILTVVDILDKPTIPPSNKMINYFEEYNEFVYISTDYGISVYDMSRLEFGDTYYIGDGGTQVKVKQTTIVDGYIYTACYSGMGFKRALIDNPNLIDFQEWEYVVSNRNYLGIQSTDEGYVYAMRGDRRVFKVNDTGVELVTIIPSPVLDYRIIENKIFVTTNSVLYIYNSDFEEELEIPIPEEYNTEFTVATKKDNYIYIGTVDYGLLKTEYINPVEFLELHPDGPLLNYSFAVQTTPNNLWVTFGDYNLTYNPAPNRERGFSHLIDEAWVNVPYDSVLGAKNLNKISVNPFNNQQVFISSFIAGIIEVNNDSPTVLYDESNSALRSLVIPGAPNYKNIRVSASTFDESGVLWSMTARVAKPLVSYDPNSGQWNSFDFTDLIPDALEGEWGYSDIEIDENGTKWIGGYKNGLIGFNNRSGVSLRSLYTEEQNMPTAFVSALAIDKRNQIWIGTISGLRVLYNTAGFFSDPAIEAQSIIILDDGLPQELLFQTYVSDIEVDGSNNKWIATIGAGLYYFSSDGQETIYHFTKDNSPLPTNDVVDVAIDQANGIVYIATDKGLVSFGSGGSQTETTLENAFIFPNPVRPDFNMADKKVKIRGITENMNVKITDIEGNLVAEAQSNTNSRYKGYNLEIDGGTAYWNGKNLGNNTVASGVYLVMLSDLESFETKVIKLMVVR
ncbi:ABC transporter substrate-binding protein [Xanthomarina sp. F2636L]|uniref:type IX secretion system anionic LPS delivery protein PorZ n=1 Tax=Xanthomarina sp. F2636L TaxID=2996018 RepID=UPI00225E15A4|nr:ABC transporter substrate-binding protein [Xanthomarina sp. F2636L]MCX7551144.1 ABC transporter substrate-binding protein [Xanthomarina sp. F2636L]